MYTLYEMLAKLPSPYTKGSLINYVLVYSLFCQYVCLLMCLPTDYRHGKTEKMIIIYDTSLRFFER